MMRRPLSIVHAIEQTCQRTQASRVGASVTLAAARHEGARGLVAEDWDGAFAANVLRLARDGDERRRLSVALRRGRVDAPLFSARRWAQGFERAISKQYCFCNQK